MDEKILSKIRKECVLLSESFTHKDLSRMSEVEVRIYATSVQLRSLIFEYSISK